MKKFFIAVLILIIVATASIFGYIAYLDREQNKDFTGKLGARIKICDSEFSLGSQEYSNVENWLDSNKSGWTNYFFTVPSGTVVLGEKINLIIAKNWVIATSYNDGVYSINAPTNSIEIECQWNDS